MNCGSCKWFREWRHLDGGGVCYLNPPVVVATHEASTYERPQVRTDDVCSHYVRLFPGDENPVNSELMRSLRFMLDKYVEPKHLRDESGECSGGGALCRAYRALARAEGKV